MEVYKTPLKLLANSVIIISKEKIISEQRNEYLTTECDFMISSCHKSFHAVGMMLRTATYWVGRSMESFVVRSTQTLPVAFNPRLITLKPCIFGFSSHPVGLVCCAFVVGGEIPIKIL